MTTDSVDPVLIVGAGPVGLVLALTLLKNGIPVRIIEKERTPRIGQRGAGVMPRSLELYHFLGVLPDVEAKAYPLVPTRVYKLPGGVEPIKTFWMSTPTAPAPSVPFINIISLGQDNAEAILRSHLAAHGCHVEFGTELLALTQRADCVEADIVKRDGEEGQRQTLLARWLVGADGARGTVRKQLGLSFMGETRGEDQRFVIGDLEVHGLDREHWHFWGDVSTILVMLRPTEEDGIYALFLGGRVDHARAVADRQELVKAIRAGTGRADLEVGEVRWLSEFRPNIRMVEKFGDGRVFVAGDAAHVHSPFGAQGMNSGIQDSFNLGWKVALVERNVAAPSLLSTYSEERLPVIAAMLQTTTAILDKTVNTMRSDGSGSEAWDRGGVLKQLGVNYRWSSIVIDERAVDDAAHKNTSGQPVDPYGRNKNDGVQAGDRAPDAPGLFDITHGDKVDANKPTSLFRIFGPSYHTVLIFAGHFDRAAPLLERLQHYPQHAVRSVVIYAADAAAFPSAEGVNLVLVDQDGHAYAGYNCAANDLTVAIIRPDGIIGAIVSGLDGLEKYFKGIFSALPVE